MSQDYAELCIWKYRLEQKDIIIEQLRAELAIALADQPELGDYSKAAANFHEAWSEEIDKNRQLREEVRELTNIVSVREDEVTGLLGINTELRAELAKSNNLVEQWQEIAGKHEAGFFAVEYERDQLRKEKAELVEALEIARSALMKGTAYKTAEVMVIDAALENARGEVDQ